MAGKGRKQVLLRLDPAVHAAIAKWAADDLRSVNAQIEVVLRRALDDAGRGVHAAPMRGRGRLSGPSAPSLYYPFTTLLSPLVYGGEERSKG